MSTNDIFAFCLIMLIVVCVFTGALVPGVITWDEMGTGIDLPAGLDFIWDAVTAFAGLLTFTIEGMPLFINLFFWVIVILTVWCVVRMPFGG